MNTIQAQPNETYTGIPTQKILLWIGMASIVMLFAGLTSAYVVRQADGNWTHFELPFAFFISTGFIILSSVSLHWSLNSVKKNELTKLKNGLMLTLVLGLAFVFTQFLAWSDLVTQGIYLVGNPSGSFLYVITGLHVAHLAGGIFYLIYVTYRSLQAKLSSKNYLIVELCAVYWHFLDGLWLYLLAFLYFIR
jgi:cytochrome c oxidase subunit III